MSNITKQNLVEDIRNRIEASKGTHIWSDYVNALKLISQVVFTRSSGFILELIQNAEDAGLGIDTPGMFEIVINKHRVKVTHNGHPFDEDNVKALCGIRSSKKPEKGTLGYLGIGFKSVFKITDCPEVYSNGFQFKFDRNHWHDPTNVPWHVIPLWIDKPSEAIDEARTTFIIPLREEGFYSNLREEIKKIRTELYLFLHWLKRIEVFDEITGEAGTLKNIGENEEGITILEHDSHQQRFKFFRRVIEEVPDWVKQDRLTQEYRANVTRREIAIAFALDERDKLAPTQAGVMYGGVYSFLPLGEERSGAKFPIQADFLVQPGRDAINYESKWNHWLAGEVASLCKEAIEYFKKHEKWKYQFLPTFEFTKSKGLESYEELFGPTLIEPIEKFLEEENCIPATDGDWTNTKQAVKLTEDREASEDLIAMGILKKEEIATVMGGLPDLKVVHPDVEDRISNPIKKVGRLGILENDDFLKAKAKTARACDWFRSFYTWLLKHPAHEEYYPSYRSRIARTRMMRYHQFEFILTSDKKLLKGGEVSLLDFPPTDPLIKDLANELQTSKPILHPDILRSKDEEEQKALRGFLTGLTGVQVLDSKIVCKEVLLPKILSDAPKPSPKVLLQNTTHCQQVLGEEVGGDLEFWVLTKKGDVRPAKEVLFPKEFKPEQDWETNRQYVPGVSFISQDYLKDITNDDQLRTWRKFFKAGGVKDAPDNGVEEFAMNYTEEKLKAYCKSLVRVDKRNFGYDIEAETQTGERMHIEVKGQSSERDVELTDNETEAADKHKDAFYLCVVSPIPNNPAMYMVQNPAAPGVGKKDKLTISVDIWKLANWLGSRKNESSRG